MKKRVFSLKKLSNGQVTVRDEIVAETFHPVIGAVEEARRLYVDQTCLADCWQNPETRCKRVWDVGLGAAANALAVVESWSRGTYGDLHLESFDLDPEALRFALAHVESEPESFAYLKGWNWDALLSQGRIMVKRGQRSLVWNFHQGDFCGNFVRIEDRPELIMYDLYSVLKCPELYSLGLWEKLRSYQEDHPVLVVFHTRSTAVRVTLLLAGWYVGVGTCLAEKEETTLASNDYGSLREPFGLKWRQKLERSTAGFPVLQGRLEKRTITAEWLDRVDRHPQWERVRCSS